MKLRVQFAHGLESNPQGSKARELRRHFELACPEMDTRDFEACVKVHAATIAREKPDVLVGSSFGGAVALALLERGMWRGPTLLLAPAHRYFSSAETLPADVPIWIVHGTCTTSFIT